MDNLKLIQERIDIDIDPNGAPGSVLAINHNEIEKDILKKVGKYSGSPYISVKQTSVLTTGLLSWESQPMNNTSPFFIKISKLNRDLNDMTVLFDNMDSGDTIHFKDYVGRSCFLEYDSFEELTDGSGNKYLKVNVKGFVNSPNYIYQVGEQEESVISLYKQLKGIIPYGRLRRKAQGSTSTNIREPQAGDIYEGWGTATQYWDSAKYLGGGDDQNRDNFIPLVFTDTE